MYLISIRNRAERIARMWLIGTSVMLLKPQTPVFFLFFFFLYVVYCSLFCWHNAKPAWLWTFSENQTELRARCRYNEGWQGSDAGPGGAILERCRFLPLQLLWGKQKQRRVQGVPGSPGRPPSGCGGVAEALPHALH